MSELIKSVHLVGIINGIPWYKKMRRIDNFKNSLIYNF